MISDDGTRADVLHFSPTQPLGADPSLLVSALTLCTVRPCVGYTGIFVGCVQQLL